jgi:uncharacterized SAM-binding protein YcdF (DUF218 family)
MSFVLSKIVGALLAPMTLLLLALAVAFVTARWRPRLSRGLLGLSLLLVLALSTVPIDHWLIDPLEHRFPDALTLQPGHVDGIIVLGGAILNTDIPFNGQPGLGDAGERATAFFELARRYPDARLVFSGGGGGIPSPAGVSEADSAKVLFNGMGLSEDRVIYERESRTTWENAQFSKQLVRPKPGERWLLVTSAWHMPRAVGCFRRNGWPVIAYAVDYLGYSDKAWLGFDAPHVLLGLNYAVKEWIGLVSYHLMGRTDTWLPSETRSDFRETPPTLAPT